MVPALTELVVNVEAVDAFVVISPSTLNITTPVIRGYRITWATDRAMTMVQGRSSVLPCDETICMIDGLPPGI
jgi:hypothetical protein